MTGHPRFPEFYVVGSQKCGTTTLYSLLRQHPQIFLPNLKESHYFSLPTPGHVYADSAAQRLNLTAIRSEKEYLAQYQTAIGRVSGEVCPTYLYSELAADRIAASREDAKIIILLREPVSRTFSAYRHMQARGAETATNFEEALLAEESHKRDGWQVMSHYVSASMYASQVQRYYNTFPHKNIMLMTFERFREDPLLAANQVVAFLGVPPLPSVASIRQTNKTVVLRNKLASNALVHQRFGVRYIRAFLPKKIRGRLKETMLSFFASATEEISSETRKQLMRRFAPDIKQLEQATGKTFEEWRNDGCTD